ncbi:hypothetical protein L1049_024713 [Liquidambar formosana]|uniref:UBL3-like ubiquitin domain-containing protein n=1 Tax=Liquidambar formosana TaxID=63359 RepID=A0AAP0WYQ1_LIQFO
MASGRFFVYIEEYSLAQLDQARASLSMVVVIHINDISSFKSLFDKTVIPKSVNDMKLIHAGKVLENSKTLAESRILFGDLPGGVTTMHVIVQPPLAKKKTGKRAFIAGVVDDNGCGWAIAKSLAAAGAEILVGTWVPVSKLT